nr:hypothetical protein [Tanacetum cinerariifolium]
SVGKPGSVGGLEGRAYGCNYGCLISGERHWGDAPQYIRDLRHSSSQLSIPVYPEAFSLPGESSHWQYKFPLPVEGVPTARRMEIPLPGVCTAMMKKLPVKERWQLH